MPPKKNVLNKLKKICEKENQVNNYVEESTDEDEKKNCYYCKKELKMVMNCNDIEVSSCNCSLFNKRVRYPKRMNIDENKQQKVERKKKTKKGPKAIEKEITEELKIIKEQVKEEPEKSVYEELYERFTNTTLN